MRHRNANKGQGTALAVIILVAIVAVAYFAVPSFQSWIKGILGQFGFSTNASIIGLTLYYSDGSTRYFEGSPASISQTILDSGSGLVVTKLGIDIFLTVEYTGTVTNYWVGASGFKWEVVDGSTVRYTGVFSEYLSLSGTSIASNTKTKIYSTELTAAQIESAWSHVAGQSYQIRLNLYSPEIELSFSDGETQTKSLATYSVIWAYKYESSGSGANQFISASISVGGTPS